MDCLLTPSDAHVLSGSEDGMQSFILHRSTTALSAVQTFNIMSLGQSLAISLGTFLCLQSFRLCCTKLIYPVISSCMFAECRPGVLLGLGGGDNGRVLPGTQRRCMLSSNAP